MRRFVRVWVAVLGAMLLSVAVAGQNCSTQPADARVLSEASAAAERSFAALAQGPGDIALIARVGQDLSAHGLHYSHVGIVLREHPDGPWTVVHLLNECGTARSAVYAEGLLNFFLDGMHSYEAKIVWLKPQLARPLLQLMQGEAPVALHDPDYNVIARWNSARDQNSTAWVLALLGAALNPAGRHDPRASIAATAQDGFVPSTIRIAYGKRLLGGLFSANADFLDHPIAARLKGLYQVVTVQSIFAWLRNSGWITLEQVIGAPQPQRD